LDNPAIELVDNPENEKRHLFKRLIYALLIGNGDLHLENLGLLRQQGKMTFSPVYDPIPMRAYPLHNMLMVMRFGRYGEWDDCLDEPVHFNAALDNFIQTLGLGTSLACDEINQAIKGLSSYALRVQALKTLPDMNKNVLITAHRQVHSLFKTYLSQTI